MIDAKSIEKFDGVNYSLWKWRMKLLLEEEGFWEIVTGAEGEPDAGDARAMERHKTKLKQAHLMICVCLGDATAEDVKDAANAKEVWEKLERAYQTRNLASCVTAKERAHERENGAW